MYHHTWYKFNFLIELDIWPESWDDRIELFTANLIQKGSPELMIKSYVSAVRAVLREDRIEVSDKSIALSSLKYTSNPSSFIRLPIQIRLLELVSETLDIFYLWKCNQPYLNLLYKSLLLMGYYGMMHIGEMTDAEGQHMIKFRDVHFGKMGKKF